MNLNSEARDGKMMCSQKRHSQNDMTGNRDEHGGSGVCQAHGLDEVSLVDSCSECEHRSTAEI